MKGSKKKKSKKAGVHIETHERRVSTLKIVKKIDSDGNEVELGKEKEGIGAEAAENEMNEGRRQWSERETINQRPRLKRKRKLKRREQKKALEKTEETANKRLRRR